MNFCCEDMQAHVRIVTEHTARLCDGEAISYLPKFHEYGLPCGDGRHLLRGNSCADNQVEKKRRKRVCLCALCAGWSSSDGRDGGGSVCRAVV